MIKQFKVLGLAIVAVLAFSALTAAAAQAVPTFKAEKYPVTVHGSGEGTETFTTAGGTVTCTTSTYDAIAEAESSTLSVHPTYSGCTAFGFISATVNTMGCNYLFHATETTAENEYKAHVDIVDESAATPCTNGIVVGVSGCKARVPKQTGLTTADLINMTTATPKDVTVRPTVGGIHYISIENSLFGCGLPAPGTEKTDGTYTSSANITVTGNEPGNSANKIGIEVAGA